MSKTFVPVNEPYIGEEEKRLVADCMETGWVSSAGKYIEQFESEFAAYCECAEGVTTTNGTAAIHLALKAVGVGPGDEVIVPSFTMAGSVYPIVQCGAAPVFVDSELETCNLDLEDMKRKITSRTKAILVVHLYGHPADMDPIMDLARSRGIVVVEDAAEAHGALYKGRKAGSIGDVGCFSFYANKIITTGEGGMLVTNDEKVAKLARQLKDLAHGEKRFTHELPEAFNYRMTNVQAAIGLGQLRRVEETIARKIASAQRYNERLADLDVLVLPVCKSWAKNVYWMYGVRVTDDCPLSKDKLMEELGKAGVATRSYFYPLDRQPAFADYARNDCPKAAKLGATGFYLPSGQTLAEEQIDYISGAMHGILSAAGH
ncbi:MAG: DegT/DnrJ/EryC1/StrS family aminotransferase [Gammaproteobacteria bacterium]